MAFYGFRSAAIRFGFVFLKPLPARRDAAGAGAVETAREIIGAAFGHTAAILHAAIGGGLDMIWRQFVNESRRERGLPAAVDLAVGGEVNLGLFSRPSDTDIGEAAFFLEACHAALVERFLRREHAFFPAGEEDEREL